jgi:hypothetical protein
LQRLRTLHAEAAAKILAARKCLVAGALGPAAACSAS